MSDTPLAAQRYAVMTDSHRICDTRRLARIHPGLRRTGASFWTDDNPEAIWEMSRETAEEVRGNLGLNNPCIMRVEKARAIIAAQRDARARREPG